MGQNENILSLITQQKEGEKPALQLATHFMKSGSTFTPVNAADMTIIEKLEPATYTVGCTSGGQYFLKLIENFELPQKLYGDTHNVAERVLSTFESRPAATGILLEGEKGSGKSMLLKLLSINARKAGMPTIVINSPFCGDGFNTFIQSISQPAIIAFDEFEKIYDRCDQEKLLTVLDGTFPSKKLFILTVNDKWRVDAHMRNRPGRIFYTRTFGGVDSAFIAEYCADNLKKMERLEGVQMVAAHFSKFTFDMLKALVEEMNRYDEPAAEAMKWLNINPSDSSGGDNRKFDVQIIHSGKMLDMTRYSKHYRTIKGNPMEYDQFYMSFNPLDEGGNSVRETKDGLVTVAFTVSADQIERFDPKSGKYTFNTDNDAFKIILTPVPETPVVYDYGAF